MASNGAIPTKRELIFDWDVFAKTPGLECFDQDSKMQELSGGIMNYVYRMRSGKDPNRTVIVKHGEGHVKKFARLPAGKERTAIELWAMKKMDGLVPGSIPRPFFYDSEQNFIIMEDLGSYQLLRDQLNSGNLEFSSVETLSSYIAKLHRSTHRATVDEKTFQEMLEFCKSGNIQRFQRIFLFEELFSRNKEEGKYVQEVREFTGDQALLSSWQKLKSIHTDHHDCLVHGDFHMSSVMIRGAAVKVFDWEFARMGPAAVDLSNLLTNFVKSFLDHKNTPLTEGSAFHELLRKAINHIVDTYFKEAEEYLDEEAVTKTVSQTAGFIGVRLVRRIYGLLEPGDMSIHPLTVKGCVRTGYRLLRDYEKIRTTRQLREYLLETE